MITLQTMFHIVALVNLAWMTTSSQGLLVCHSSGNWPHDMSIQDNWLSNEYFLAACENDVTPYCMKAVGNWTVQTESGRTNENYGVKRGCARKWETNLYFGETPPKWDECRDVDRQNITMPSQGYSNHSFVGRICFCTTEKCNSTVKGVGFSAVLILAGLAVAFIRHFK